MFRPHSKQSPLYFFWPCIQWTERIQSQPHLCITLTMPIWYIRLCGNFTRPKETCKICTKVFLISFENWIFFWHKKTLSQLRTQPQLISLIMLPLNSIIKIPRGTYKFMLIFVLCQYRLRSCFEKRRSTYSNGSTAYAT